MYISGMVLCFFFFPKTKFDKNERQPAYSNFLVNNTHSIPRTGTKEWRKWRGHEYSLGGPPHCSESDLCRSRLGWNNSGSCRSFPVRITVPTDYAETGKVWCPSPLMLGSDPLLHWGMMERWGNFGDTGKKGSPGVWLKFPVSRK